MNAQGFADEFKLGYEVIRQYRQKDRTYYDLRLTNNVNANTMIVTAYSPSPFTSIMHPSEVWDDLLIFMNTYGDRLYNWERDLKEANSSVIDPDDLDEDDVRWLKDAMDFRNFLGNADAWSTLIDFVVLGEYDVLGEDE